MIEKEEIYTVVYDGWVYYGSRNKAISFIIRTDEGTWDKEPI